MRLQPILTKGDYAAALREVERLRDAPEKSPEAEQLEVLALLIEDYERRNFPIYSPDSIDSGTAGSTWLLSACTPEWTRGAGLALLMSKHGRRVGVEIKRADALGFGLHATPGVTLRKRYGAATSRHHVSRLVATDPR